MNLFYVLNNDLGIATRVNPSDPTKAQWRPMGSEDAWQNFCSAAQCVLIQKVTSTSDAAITVDIKDKIPTYQKLTEKDFMLNVTYIYASSYTSGEYTAWVDKYQNIAYSPNTGVVTITGLYARKVNSTNNSINARVAADLYAFPNGLNIS